MIEKLIERALTDRSKSMIDNRHLFLHIDFHMSKKDTVALTEKVTEDLIYPLKDEYIFDIDADVKSGVTPEKGMSLFRQELISQGSGSLCMEIYKKSSKLKSLSAVNRFMNRWYQNEYFNVAKEYERIHSELSRRIENAVEAGTLEEEIINHGNDVSDGEPGFSDMAFLIMADESEAVPGETCGFIDFEVSLYSLGGNLDTAADYFAEKLKDFCMISENMGGYVSRGVYHSSEKGEFFYYRPDGVVRDDDGTMFSSDEWFARNYVSGVEWFNLFSAAVSKKVKDFDGLKKAETVYCDCLKDGRIIAGINKKLSEYRAADWAPVYNSVRDCLTPGYLDDEAAETLLLERDLYFEQTEYRIEGNKIYFQRGTTDFLLPEKKSRGQQILDYQEIIRRIEALFCTECSFYSGETNQQEKIEQYLDEQKKKGRYPVIISLEEPMAALLSDILSESAATDKEQDEFSTYEAEDNGNLERNFTPQGYQRESVRLPLIVVSLKEKPWRILASLQADDWMGCASSSVHLARKWFRLYGAYPAVITHDTLDFEVPVKIDEETAIDLAVEQSTFCPTLLEVGYSREEAAAALVAELKNSSVWHFWWD